MRHIGSDKILLIVHSTSHKHEDVGWIFEPIQSSSIILLHL